MSQYVRDRWSTESGFPRGPVYSISQTPDGYLWAGTEAGLVRFDGQKFSLTQSGVSDFPVLTHVLGLVNDRDGSLWVRLRRPTLLRYKAGTFTSPVASLGHPHSTVAALGRSAQGNLLVWLLDGEPAAAELRDGTLRTVAAPKGFSRSPVLALAQTEDGNIWVGTRDAGLYRIRSGQITQITEGLPDPKVNALAAAGRNSLWVGTDRGLVRWDGARLVSFGVPSALDKAQALALLVDRDSNLWVGTGSQGLARVNALGVAWIYDSDKSDHNPAITALYEDREGGIWAGSARTLERFRDSAFVTYSSSEGMPSDQSGPVSADSEGRIWFAPKQGGLWLIRGQSPETVHAAGLSSDIIYSIFAGRSGLWVGRQRGGLTVLRSNPRGFSAMTYTVNHGLAQNSVYSVHEAKDGSVWAGTLSAGVSRLYEGKFRTWTSDSGLASDTVTAMAESSDGSIWFATPQGLSRFDGRIWSSFHIPQGLPSDNVNCLLSDSEDVLWIGTAAGLAYRKAGTFHTVKDWPDSLHEQILGIAEDKQGSLWLATAGRVLRVNRSRLMAGRLGEADFREFNRADGLRGSEGVKRSRSVIADSAGRIWFSLNGGLSEVDPARIGRASSPALVRVEEVVADESLIGLEGSRHIPGSTRRLTIRYTGLSLSIPERVRYRYRLDNFDSGWSAPDPDREAVYTNLAPGSYRFRVIASNADSIWSPQEGTIDFAVDPLVWQTWWFRLGLLSACGLAGVAIYRYRLAATAGQLNMRFEERLSERTRIAQELHDTLLQGFLSVSMQAHVLESTLPPQSPAKPLLAGALDTMRRVIGEGRNAVRGLRTSQTASLDLEQAFLQLRQELVRPDEQVDFRIIIDGRQRPLHPLTRDEVYRIGREALINAFRHANATQIEVELKYSAREFGVLVRDNGAGVDETKLLGGSAHRGLWGMRERTERIGGRFHLYTAPSGGTDIEITIPGAVAFSDRANSRLRWPWRRVQSNGPTDHTSNDANDRSSPYSNSERR